MADSLSTFVVHDAVVGIDRNGAIDAVAHTSRAALSYLSIGRPADPAVEWAAVNVVVDADEVETTLTATTGLVATVRHTFVAGWQWRCALTNSSAEPRAVRLRLPLTCSAESVGWALAEGAEAELFVQPGDGRGPILAGRLRHGSVERIEASGLVLPELTLDPGGRYVFDWEWDWLSGAAAYVRKRPTNHPTATTVIRGEVIAVPGGPDVAVVAPDGVVLEGGGPAVYELSSVDPVSAPVELRSARGLRRLRLQWTPTAGELLRRAANDLLAAPRGPVGVVVLPGLEAAVTLQWALGAESLDAADDAGDALDLFTARLVESRQDRGLAALYLCGEYERNGDGDLLAAAGRRLLDATRPEPGLGVAATRVCLAQVARGSPPQSIVDRLLALAGREPADPDGADGRATTAELLTVTGTVEPAARPGRLPWDDTLLRLVVGLGTELGAGLPGQPVRPLPVGRLGHVLTVLRMLPDSLAEPTRRLWGIAASDLAERLTPTLIARLEGRDVGRGHVWLTLLTSSD